MPADRDSPAEGQESTDCETDREAWETLARALLCEELERVEVHAGSTFDVVTERVDAGRPITEETVTQLEQVMRDVEIVVDELRVFLEAVEPSRIPSETGSGSGRGINTGNSPDSEG